MAGLGLSVTVGLQTLRQSPLHTLLSTLGIVVGVASLVAILSLGDGLEQFARDQIVATTDLQLITVTPRTTRQVDGINVPLSDYPSLMPADALALANYLGADASVALSQIRGAQVRVASSPAASGAVLVATTAKALDVAGDTLIAGRFLSEADLAGHAHVVVVSATLAEHLLQSDVAAAALGRSVLMSDEAFEIVGVVRTARGDRSLAYVPFGVPDLGRDPKPAQVTIQAGRVEDVPAIRARVEDWIRERYGAVDERFTVATNDWRVSQARRGVLLFKLVMGTITGIAIVVGGIGVMNVLLVSIAQRTREIGIRRATGARQRDVLLQFLVESVTITGVGSVLGILLGLGSMLVFVPVARRLTDVPFRIGFSVSTVAVSMLAAIVVGVLFGTYPAWRASHLDPAEAVRHE